MPPTLGEAKYPSKRAYPAGGWTSLGEKGAKEFLKHALQINKAFRSMEGHAGWWVLWPDGRAWAPCAGRAMAGIAHEPMAAHLAPFPVVVNSLSLWEAGKERKSLISKLTEEKEGVGVSFLGERPSLFLQAISKASLLEAASEWSKRGAGPEALEVLEGAGEKESEPFPIEEILAASSRRRVTVLHIKPGRLSLRLAPSHLSPLALALAAGPGAVGHKSLSESGGRGRVVAATSFPGDAARLFLKGGLVFSPW